jgi:hypothetical protein
MVKDVNVGWVKVRITPSLHIDFILDVPCQLLVFVLYLYLLQKLVKVKDKGAVDPRTFVILTFLLSFHTFK